jgi:hypothetical protein
MRSSEPETRQVMKRSFDMFLPGEVEYNRIKENDYALPKNN